MDWIDVFEQIYHFDRFEGPERVIRDKSYPMEEIRDNVFHKRYHFTKENI
jgi:hypothetical protein